MARQFILPDLGEGIHEAQVVNVMIKEGDTVTQDQMVMEVETDKAAVELPVPYAGVIAKLNVKTGDTITVGQVLLEVDDGTTASAETAASTKGVPVPAAGGAVTVAVAGPAAQLDEAPEYGPGPIPAAPAVRRLAREWGIDLHKVRGSGPGGRILREDVERHREARASGAALPDVAPSPSVVSGAQPPLVVSRPTPAPRPAAPPALSPAPGAAVPPAPSAAEPLPDFAQWGPVRKEKVPQIRKTIARQMARAWAIIPHVTHLDEADVTDLESFRKQQAAVFERQGAKLTLTAFILKAVAGALRQFPKFNASFDEAAGEIVYKDYIHVGVAVDSPRGLIVPVLREVDRKGLVTISKELRDIADRAREFKIDVPEMRGGTFTITNVGALGGIFATPMINWPEVAILGIGKLADKPVVREGQVVVRKMLPLMLAFDHRVIDGADGARFMNTVKMMLENPLNLLFVS